MVILCWLMWLQPFWQYKAQSELCQQVVSKHLLINKQYLDLLQSENNLERNFQYVAHKVGEGAENGAGGGYQQHTGGLKSLHKSTVAPNGFSRDSFSSFCCLVLEEPGMFEDTCISLTKVSKVPKKQQCCLRATTCLLHLASENPEVCDWNEHLPWS